MQWDSSANAGFAPLGVTTWLPVAEDFAQRNVAVQETDPVSMLNLYCALTRLRRKEPALHAGDYAPVDASADDIFAYLRTAPGSDHFLIVLNFGDAAHTLDLAHVAPTAKIAAATDMVRQGPVDLGNLAIGVNEGLVLRLQE
jgi:alpha-glucosidase